ncbi:uncharacterized protein K489DRAFT_208021 [Dissoconium aciculare CBS 342.82]|uniref:Secreted protein n=1 Tax=Dissoconium aciculare CBS 342.82 TaxID=1314786 RepID=A0A6J3MAF4_9PEZI|nr:uncharacterized protein K489DRAFT_208021 [Dissoconium aciculare CBS 342.82]KAF1823797.1 hypothetical protein K489DRAFT_208021 [Dissoconium aciculare CBS 342.82]
MMACWARLLQIWQLSSGAPLTECGSSVGTLLLTSGESWSWRKTSSRLESNWCHLGGYGACGQMKMYKQCRTTYSHV